MLKWGDNFELKWLEDLICVAEKGHFARAAEARHITQSALSRRIKSLEVWVGAELMDRTRHPITLTSAGAEFMPVAYDIVERSYEGRNHAAELVRLPDTAVAIACMHTIAIYQIPNIISKLQQNIGPFETSIVADTRTADEYLTSLLNGSCDFFVCYTHPSLSFNIDEERFPKIDIGIDRIMPYQLGDAPLIDLSDDSQASIPYLQYTGTSILSRVVQSITQAAPFRRRLNTLYNVSLAESLCTAALNGLGVAWLPESIIKNVPRADRLVSLGSKWSTTLNVSVYRSASNSRKIVNTIWDEFSRKAVSTNS